MTDEEIGRQLREAEARGEFRGLAGRPLPVDEGWDATPAELRLPFKVLKNAGWVPPELAWFRERAQLQAELAAADAAQRAVLERRLADLQQKIALRLEGLRVHRTL
ncbi:DnaJ family domain-containing protein [Piscinibacter sakaiensis]|uniref:Transcriptional regulators n=1 Tax=Piscinibacter sakaiensis TaxID=1547922 RepID=A0A0K8NXT7_PISS1|nr:DnaJ family domain-containing protein [Piscinibacter sakaiensis]GAP35212.1 transcriptional regulators [Piscinibacter sakaiensis]